jgi:hypothetical protein
MIDTHYYSDTLEPIRAEKHYSYAPTFVSTQHHHRPYQHTMRLTTINYRAQPYPDSIFIVLCFMLNLLRPNYIAAVVGPAVEQTHASPRAYRAPQDAHIVKDFVTSLAECARISLTALRSLASSWPP